MMNDDGKDCRDNSDHSIWISTVREELRVQHAAQFVQQPSSDDDEGCIGYVATRDTILFDELCVC
jgi:hypothetical protein